MFCYQCEQTFKGTGCTIQGICGKQPDVAALQDLLLYILMELSQIALEARKAGINDEKVNVFTIKAAFATLTNVDFDPDRFFKLVNEAVFLYENLKAKIRNNGEYEDFKDTLADLIPSPDIEGMVKQGEKVGIKTYPADNPDILLRTDLTLDDWLGLTLRCGEAALKAMELLDAGNAKTYGHPAGTFSACFYDTEYPCNTGQII